MGHSFTLFLLLHTFLPSSSFPQDSYFDFKSFPVTAGSHYQKPAPLYHKPVPVYHKPAPVYHKPAPVYHKPAPVYGKPVPIYHKPKPVPVHKIAGPPYPHTSSSYEPKPAAHPAFVNLGPVYAPTEAPAEEEAPEDVKDAEVAEVVALREEDKSSESGESEKLVVNDTGSKTLSLTKEELIEIAVERMKEMEELKEDGLVVLEPQSTGVIVSIDEEAALDGMNIVEFNDANI